MCYSLCCELSRILSCLPYLTSHIRSQLHLTFMVPSTSLFVAFQPITWSLGGGRGDDSDGGVDRYGKAACGTVL